MAKDLEKVEENMSERFTTAVLKEFGTNTGAIKPTEYQKSLVQGYFIAVDHMLLDLEAERERKNNKNTNHNFDNPVAYNWSNVNMQSLARDVMCYSKMGLDMLADNHLFAIPYKNNKTKKYDLGFIKGYNGIKMLVEKYALVKPKVVTIEVVYSNDTFKPLKKCRGNDVESYEFDIPNAFERGKIIGGFGYVEYEDASKNKIFVMTMADIEKRKPKYAAAEFWGGEKDEYDNGKKTGKKIEIEGWQDEMVYKSLIRHVYGKLPLDPQKIDDAYRYIQSRESEYKDMEVADEVASNANKETINITPDKQETTHELPPAQPVVKPPVYHHETAKQTETVEAQRLQF